MQKTGLEMERERPREGATELVKLGGPGRRRRVFLDGSGTPVKQCGHCEQVLTLDKFYVRKNGQVAPRCRVCRELVRDRKGENEAQLKRYHENHAQSLEKQREYQRNNRDKYRKASRDWRERNPEKMDAIKKDWDQRNRHKNAASSKRYYTRKRNQMPKWLTPDQIEEMNELYLWARILTDETGIKHSVDHIEPLHGEHSCGLHVPWNLRVITASENSSKGNKLLPQAQENWAALVRAGGGMALIVNQEGMLP